jgi:hypothetical protein
MSSWNIQSQHYGYTVDGIFYNSKINALQAASGDVNRLKLYFFDDSTNQWADYSIATANYPFVTSFTNGINTADSNIGQLTITATRSMAT